MKISMKILKTLIKNVNVYAHPKFFLLLVIPILINPVWIGVNCTWVKEVCLSWQNTLRNFQVPCKHWIHLSKFTNIPMMWLSEASKYSRLHDRNIIVPVDNSRHCYCMFCYCVFVILLRLIGNYVSSDAMNMISVITARKHNTYQILVRPI